MKNQIDEADAEQFQTVQIEGGEIFQQSKSALDEAGFEENESAEMEGEQLD